MDRDLSPIGYLHNQGSVKVAEDSKSEFSPPQKTPPPNPRDSRYLHTECTDGNSIAEIPSLYQEGQGLQVHFEGKQGKNPVNINSISILKAPWATILEESLHYTKKDKACKRIKPVKQKVEIWLYFKEATQITVTVDTSIPRSPLPTILHRPLHYIYKETLSNDSRYLWNEGINSNDIAGEAEWENLVVFQGSNPNSNNSRYLHTEVAAANNIAGSSLLHIEEHAAQWENLVVFQGSNPPNNNNSRYLHTEVAAANDIARSSSLHIEEHADQVSNRLTQQIRKKRLNMDGKDNGQNVAEKWASTKPTPPQPTNKATVPPLGSVPKGHPLNCERTMVAGHTLLVIGKWNQHYTAADAMRVLEFSEEDCKNKSLQRRVRRQRDRQLKNSSPLFIQTNSTSLISSLSNPPSTNNHTNSAANNSSSSHGDGGGNNNNNNNNNTALAAVASAATALAATGLTATGLVPPATATDSISAGGVLAKPKPRRNHTMVMYDKEQTQDARKRYCKSYETAGYMYKMFDIPSLLMMLSDGSIDLDADPATVQLLDLEFRNVNAIATLKEHGFAGEVFLKQAPRNYGKNSIATLPNTRARQDQIQEAKNTPGPKYAVLNGGAYNCMDQIIVHERIRREGIIKAMEGTKYKAAAYDKKREAAQPLIDKCDGDFMDLPVSELRKVFEWKLQEKSTHLNKDDMVGALMEAEKYPPVGEVKKIAEDEAEMKRLIEEDIKIKDTELGKAMAKDIKEMHSMTKSITPQRMEIAEAHLTQEELEHLRAVRMQDSAENTNNNNITHLLKEIQRSFYQVRARMKEYGIMDIESTDNALEPQEKYTTSKSLSNPEKKQIYFPNKIVTLSYWAEQGHSNDKEDAPKSLVLTNGELPSTAQNPRMLHPFQLTTQNELQGAISLCHR
eukprot:jgi/Psemu1/6722/gm1.6722_g